MIFFIAGAKLTIDHARQRHALATQCRRALGNSLLTIRCAVDYFSLMSVSLYSIDLHRIDALKARHELAKQRTEEMQQTEVFSITSLLFSFVNVVIYYCLKNIAQKFDRETEFAKDSVGSNAKT